MAKWNKTEIVKEPPIEEHLKHVIERQKEWIARLQANVTELESGLRVEAMKFAVEACRGQGIGETMKAFHEIFKVLIGPKEEGKETSQWE